MGYDETSTVSIPLVLIAFTVSLILISCGPQPANTPASAPAPATSPTTLATKADVILTFDGVRHVCVIALPTEAQGSVVTCAEVVPFFRDELRLASGSAYEVRAVAPVDESEKKRVLEELGRAGYRFVKD